MDKKNLKQKKTTRKKSGLLKCLFMCITYNNEEENDNICNKPTINLQPSYDILSARPQVSFLSTTASSYCVINPELTSINNALSQVYSEKIENMSLNETKEFIPPSEHRENLDRNQKDQLVRTILGKYLAIKRDERLNKKPEEDDDDQKISPTGEKSDFLSIKVSSSDSLKTVLLDESDNHETVRPKIDFPTKSKSAPTNSEAHDSLADICFKMNRFKQQDNKSDSYVTCCSDETNTQTNTSADIKESTTPKKKLELIFNHQWSDETSSSREEPSLLSLQYKISCEPLTTGSLAAESVLQQGDESCECVMTPSKREKLCQELYLQPTAIGEIGGFNGSTSSLRWKLIISHHGHGDE